MCRIRWVCFGQGSHTVGQFVRPSPYRILIALNSNAVLEQFLVVITFVDRALIIEIDKARLDHRGAAHEIDLNPLQIAFEFAACLEAQSRRYSRIQSIEAIKDGSRKVRCISIG